MSAAGAAPVTAGVVRPGAGGITPGHGVYDVDSVYTVGMGVETTRRDVGGLATVGGAGLLAFVALVAVLHVVDPGRDPVAMAVPRTARRGCSA
jgi:hypothetical protein